MISAFDPASAGAGGPHDEATRYQLHVRSEIAQMGEFLQDHPMTDLVSRKIQHWFEGFKGALAECRGVSTADTFDANTKVVHLNFMELLDAELRDPLGGLPLDEQAYRGSDGYTYNSLTLSIWLSLEKPATYGDRSPLVPEDPSCFSVVPHPVARHFVKWLNAYRIRPEAGLEEVREFYNQLKRDRRIVRLPTPEYLSMKGMMAEAKAVREAAERRTDEMAREVGRGMVEDGRAFKEALEFGRRAADEALGRTAEAIRAKLDEVEREDERVRAEHAERVRRVEADLKAAEAEMKAVHSGLMETGDSLKWTREETRGLKRAIDETREKMDQQDREASEGGFFKTLLTIGVCAVTSYFLKQIVPWAQVGPVTGGAGVKFGIPF